MSKNRTTYICAECGYRSPKWLGKCPGCGSWNTLEEVEERDSRTPLTKTFSAEGNGPVPITEIQDCERARMKTGIKELDRVLGGGFVAGSLTVLGGDPGIGKSTLLLQAAHRLAALGDQVLYVSAEEAPHQVRIRAQRLAALCENVLLLGETDVTKIAGAAISTEPGLLVIDSIQTVYHPDVEGAPGGIAQVRECGAYLMRLAKAKGITTVLVGHVTKGGDLAGPRALEHLVDVVLDFEGERLQSFRILRGLKNRFGSTNEIGIFRMTSGGLVEVKNPSRFFLSRKEEGTPGSAVTCSMEGTRPVLVEIQALVTKSYLANPRRIARGIDRTRLSMVAAILEKRLGIRLAEADIYVNVAGGLKLTEPAADLAIAAAVVSSLHDLPLSRKDIIIGELALTGEIKPVGRMEGRLKEGERLGFLRAIVPKDRENGQPSRLRVVEVADIRQAGRVLFAKK